MEITDFLDLARLIVRIVLWLVIAISAGVWTAVPSAEDRKDIFQLFVMAALLLMVLQ